ncbi:MAG: ATP-binding protein [bacterium]
MKSKPKLHTISESNISDRMKAENPWWISGFINNEFNELKRRKYFEMFKSLVEDIDIKRAVVLMGPRRVGKTVMMHHTIQYLLDQKIDRQKICFLSIDNPIYNNIGLEQLFSIARKAVAQNDPKGWYVFFDEIQYLKEWERHVKTMVDSYPHTKFIVSGSAAAALKMSSIESGAGRMTDFMLPPLTFYEYIYLMGCEHLVYPVKINWIGNTQNFYSTINHTEFNKHFINYINYGGYPEVIFSESIRKNPTTFIKSDIIDKVLLRDLPSLYGIQDIQELNNFFTTLAYNSGNEVSLDALSNESGIQKNLIKKYLEYFEAAFLIKKIHRIDDNAKKFKRENYYKIYLTNPSLRAALFYPITSNDEMTGNMVETAIFSQWMQRDWFIPMYARWTEGRFQGEVDMVGLSNIKLKPIWAVEIKWSNRFFERPEELKSLLLFCKKNNLNSAMITTLDKEGEKILEGITLNFVSSAIYAYVVGENTIKEKQLRT